MESLFLLIPIAIVFVAIAVKLFFWAVDSGQFEDLDSDGQRILFDDDVPTSKQSQQASSSMNQDQSAASDQACANPASSNQTSSDQQPAPSPGSLPRSSPSSSPSSSD